MLKLQYFGLLVWRDVSLGKTLMLGKIEGKRRRQWERMRYLSHQVQVRSSWLTIGQWTREMRRWGKEETLIREPADQEDGWLAPQNSYLIGVWMAGCFIDQRERSNEEPKSKGRIGRERQWESKAKGSSVLQNISREWPASGRRGVLISSIHRWAGTNYLSRSWTKALWFTV